MPIKTYTLGGARKSLFHFANSANNKTNGRVDKRKQGALTFVKSRTITDVKGRVNGSDVYADDALAAYTHDVPSNVLGLNRLTAEARARFDGKLRKGHADLGVTLGSWNQSWDMIGKRARQSARSLDRVIRGLEADKNLSQRERIHRRISARERKLREWKKDNSYLETPANLVLEGEFGWLPLFSDAKNAFGVMSQPSPNGWVTGRATSHYDYVSSGGSNPKRTVTFQGGTSRVSICANVWVDNPNIWLANQLGLLNLPGVAWDLVPWSFVVNMFTNLGQIANSFTAYYGLSMNNVSTTTSHRHMRDEYVDYGTGWPDALIAHSRNIVSYKNRTLGSIPFPPFYTKMPELSFETAVIAVSLAIQQVSRITRLLR